MEARNEKKEEEHTHTDLKRLDFSNLPFYFLGCYHHGLVY